MLLSVAEGFPRVPTISDRHLQQADAILDWTRERLPDVYAFVGNTRYGTAAQRILQYVRRSGGSVRERLICIDHMMYHPPDETLRILNDWARVGRLKSTNRAGTVEWKEV